MTETKLCSRCGKVKLHNAFSECKRAPDNLAYYCKSCYAELSKRGQEKNKANHVPYRPEELATEVKQCPSCGEKKTYGEFYVNKCRKDGLTCYCKACSRTKGKKNRREWRADNPEKVAAFNKRRRQDSLEKAGRHWAQYGIIFTSEEYDKRLALQDNCCCICGRPASDFKKRLCVDHNHDIGQVRGITCNYCNTVIGIIENKQGLIKKVEEYLEVWNGLPG